MPLVLLKGRPEFFNIVAADYQKTIENKKKLQEYINNIWGIFEKEVAQKPLMLLAILAVAGYTMYSFDLLDGPYKYIDKKTEKPIYKWIYARLKENNLEKKLETPVQSADALMDLSGKKKSDAIKKLKDIFTNRDYNASITKCLDGFLKDVSLPKAFSQEGFADFVANLFGVVNPAKVLGFACCIGNSIKEPLIDSMIVGYLSKPLYEDG
jgi:hypothetical protein